MAATAVEAWDERWATPDGFTFPLLGHFQTVFRTLMLALMN